MKLWHLALAAGVLLYATKPANASAGGESIASKLGKVWDSSVAGSTSPNLGTLPRPKLDGAWPDGSSGGGSTW